MSDYIRLPGGDDVSDTVLSNGEILRIYKNDQFFREAVSVLGLVQSENLLKDLVVETQICDRAEVKNALLHSVQTFNLPENWTLNQYLDVIQSHYSLINILEKKHLALKDHLPENFVISRGFPVFVDFGSIVNKSSLGEISWLTENRGRKSVAAYLISEMMFPFFLLPIFVGLINSEDEMRKMLKYEYCNSGFKKSSWRRINLKNLFMKFKPSISLRVLVFFLSIRTFRSESEFMARAIELLRVLFANSDRSSSYLDYYQLKNEQFDFDSDADWNTKQTSVRDILVRQDSSDVLDLGCNTGWFSVLAAKHNFKVKAVDIDPVIVDHLYLQAKRENLNVEVAVLGLDDFAYFKGQELSRQDSPGTASRKLPPSAYDADLVLALGLIHHLILGLGYTVEDVMFLLASLTRKTLVLEFVRLDDEKIVSEPEFFPAINQTRLSYTKEQIIQMGLKHFAKVEIFPSNPSTREILVFSRN